MLEPHFSSFDLIRRASENDPTLTGVTRSMMLRLRPAEAVALAHALRRNTAVVQFHGCSLPSEALRIILGAIESGENRTLEVLSIDHSAIASEVAAAFGAALEKSACLRGLYLHGCLIGDAGASSIAYGLVRSASLRRLYLTRCGVGDAGAASLASALRSNRSLQELRLHSNPDIGRLGTSFVARVLKHDNHTLRDVYLYPAPDHSVPRLYAEINGRYGPTEAEIRKTGLFPRKHLRPVLPGALGPIALKRVMEWGELGVTFDFVREKNTEVLCA